MGLCGKRAVFPRLSLVMWKELGHNGKWVDAMGLTVEADLGKQTSWNVRRG